MARRYPRRRSAAAGWSPPSMCTMLRWPRSVRLGAYTACLHDRPLAEALEVLKAEGLTSVEVNTGGFIPSPHCHVDGLLGSEQARRCYLAEFSARDMELTG